MSELDRRIGDPKLNNRPFILHEVVTPNGLNEWRRKLNRASQFNYIPISLLLSTFAPEDVVGVLGQPREYNDDILNVTTDSPVSLRRLNDAYVWSNVLKHVKASGEVITELCPGNSVVMDIALGFADFQGSFFKADSLDWSNGNGLHMIRLYGKKNIKIDVINQVEIIPESDLIVMNHAVDDLFIGLWAQDHNLEYFTRFNLEYGADNLQELNRLAWQSALSDPDKYIAILRGFVRGLSGRVKEGGKVIFRNYPSNFETRHKLIERINFTHSLTEDLVQTMVEDGFKLVPVDLDEIDGAEGSKFKNSFYVLEKRDKPVQNQPQN